MAVAEAVSACLCETVTLATVQCPEHFKLWRGGRRLTSVRRIIHATFPLDPSIPPDVLENARDRGEQTDRLFAEWLRGKLDCIPADTRDDSKALFDKLVGWFQKQDFAKIQVQVVLGGEDHGGVVDLIIDDMVVDLKCTSKVEHTHRLQVAAYANLMDSTRGQVLHVTSRLKEPKFVPMVSQDYDDWRTLLDCWRMARRRSKQMEISE